MLNSNLSQCICNQDPCKCEFSRKSKSFSRMGSTESINENQNKETVENKRQKFLK